MFTGIITHLSRIIQIDRSQQDWIIAMSLPFTPDLGASIAFNGICLTIASINSSDSSSDSGVYRSQTKPTEYDSIVSVCISQATRSVTDSSSWREGDLLNVERSLLIGDRLDGHFVFGHVDCVGEIISLDKVGESHNRLRIRLDRVEEGRDYEGDLDNGLNIKTYDSYDGTRTNSSSEQGEQATSTRRVLNIRDTCNGQAKGEVKVRDPKCNEAISLNSFAYDAFDCIVLKGSITLNGIAFTINSVDRVERMIEVNVIPYTYQNTNLRRASVGKSVNIELDMMGKYVANLMLR